MKEQISVRKEQIRQLVLERILEGGFKDKLWMRRKLEEEEAEPGLVLYPAKDNQQEMMEQLRELFQKELQEGRTLPISRETRNRILLEFQVDKYRIPFFIEVKPYKAAAVYPVEETMGKMKYYRFPTEEYIARGFYEILDKLELINDLSWYKQIYDIILVEAVDGRRIRESFGKLLEAKKIPSLEKRLDTIKSYENYGYMRKKWKAEKKRCNSEFPEWAQVVSLLVTFFAPIFHAVTEDEIFYGDWMPQLGRYL